MGAVIILILIAIVLFLVDRYFLSYWKRHGFEQIKPTFFFGNALKLVTLAAPIPDIFDEYYYKSKGRKFMGLYNFYRPSLLVNDPELIHNILIRDFSSFHDHGITVDADNDPLSANLFSLTGQKWRDLRVRLSPAFTSGKLRWMFPNMKQCSDALVDHFKKNLERNENEFCLNEAFKRYNSTLISSVAFGIDNDCINQPNNDFFTYGMKFFEPNIRNVTRQFLFFFLPKFMILFKIKFAPEDVDKFFKQLVKEIVEYREKNNFKRNDFMDLLIQLKDQGYVSADKEILDEDETSNFNSEYGTEKISEHHEFTFEDLAAQAFVFFLAAFETTSAAIGFCMIELAKKSELQKKVQDEIDEVFSTQEVTYEALKRLKYLDCCLLEGLRKYPPVPFLSRDCTKDYQIPNTDLIIQKGTEIKIPIMSIHRDPEIYDNPLEFRPERFMDSPTGDSLLNNEKSVIFYSPFGDGPRHCIGMRMAKVNAKLVIASLLSNFTFSLVNEKLYHEEIKFDRKSFPLRPCNDEKLKFKAR